MILVFGSINVDAVVGVPHLPVPGETVLGGDYALLPGGKGANQALAARRAGGGSVMMAGAVGEDAFADVALGGLRAAGVDLGLVQRVGRPTGCALIMVGEEGEQRGENLIAVASGANHAVLAGDVPDAALGPETVVLCQMEVTAAENWALLRRARAAGARTVLNFAPAAPIDAAALPDIDVLIANEGEAATLGNNPADFAARLGQALIVTQGAAGSTAFLAHGGRGSRRIGIPALPIMPVDTTGAGDTFAGVLAAGLDQGVGLVVALRRASVAAALACLGHGAQTAMPDSAAINAAMPRLAG